MRDPFEPGWAARRSSDLALLRGQLGKWRQLRTVGFAADSSIGRRPPAIIAIAGAARISASVRGTATEELNAVDAALARGALRAIPDAERPDLGVAQNLAWAGRPDRARAVLAEYQTSVRDTAVKRSWMADLHTALGAIALAEKRYDDAFKEFRKGDSLPDGPANACGICLPLYFGRTFDAANLPDSAIAQFETYLSAPQFGRIDDLLDPTSRPAIHERLGQLYEAKRNLPKAAEHYRAFIELWKHADPELQPRVAEARRRLSKLGTGDGPKPQVLKGGVRP